MKNSFSYTENKMYAMTIRKKQRTSIFVKITLQNHVVG